MRSTKSSAETGALLIELGEFGCRGSSFWPLLERTRQKSGHHFVIEGHTPAQPATPCALSLFLSAVQTILSRNQLLPSPMN